MALMTRLSTRLQQEPVQNLLGHSSDLFDSLGFRITPEMSWIINLARYTFLPSLYTYPYIKRLSAKLPANVKPSSTGEQLAEGNGKLGFSCEGCAMKMMANRDTNWNEWLYN